MISRRKIAILAGTAAALLLLLALVPLLARGPIATRVRAEIDRSVNAHVSWGGVQIGVIRNFPNVTFGLTNLAVVGADRFEGDTLASMRQFRLVLDARSVIGSLRRGSPIVIRSVELDRPVARLKALEDGSANWDIMRAEADTDTAAASGALAVSLRKLEIRDGQFSLDDRAAGLLASATGVRQTISGDFASDQFVIRTRTESDAVSVRFAGVPYLRNVRLDLTANVDADMQQRRFTLGENSLRLNELVLLFSGAVALHDDERVTTDVTFSAPRTEFGDILSLVPAVYARDFATIRTTGSMSVSGHVRGDYGPNAFPAFALHAKVEDGTFRYPDLPLPARDIALDLRVDNPGGDIDRTVVDLRRFHLVIGNRPVDGTFTMRTPVSDPDIDLRVAGSVDLADVQRTVKLEGVEELSGRLAADLAVQGRMSDMEHGRYDRVQARGRFDMARLALRSADLPHAMQVDTAALRFTPRHAELAAFRGQIGQSDFQATGSLDNILGYALRDQVLRGRATVSSARFVLDEWRSDDGEMEVIPVPPNIDFTLQASVARLTFADLEMTNARGGLRIHDRRVTLDDFQMNMLGGAVAASGYYETLPGVRPTFDMNLRVRELDIPQAFASLTTVQVFAPVARYARGNFSSELQMNGALSEQMTPVFDAVSARGAFATAQLVLQDFPAMHKLADALRIPEFRNPGFEAVRASFEIREGRLHVSPFDVSLGASRMQIAGSNGIDQSLDYTLKLDVPKAMLGAEANRAMATLVSQSARAGIDLDAAEMLNLGVRVTGAITNPSLATSFAGATGNVRRQVEQSLRDQVEQRTEAVEQRIDAATEDARRRAREEADRIVAEAEQRAATIREEARGVAATVRREGEEQATALLERATSPVARVAAQPAADRLRREANSRADRIEREGDERANELVAESRRRADALVQP